MIKIVCKAVNELRKISSKQWTIPMKASSENIWSLKQTLVMQHYGKRVTFAEAAIYSRQTSYILRGDNKILLSDTPSILCLRNNLALSSHSKPFLPSWSWRWYPGVQLQERLHSQLVSSCSSESRGFLQPHFPPWRLRVPLPPQFFLTAQQDHFPPHLLLKPKFPY